MAVALLREPFGLSLPCQRAEQSFHHLPLTGNQGVSELLTGLLCAATAGVPVLSSSLQPLQN